MAPPALTDEALRVMFDTNAYDAILAAGDLDRLREKIAAGELSVVTTHIQEDEIRQIRDPSRQRALLDAFRALDGRRVDPAQAIIEDIRYMARDDMLIRIAASHCDLLVSDDKGLAAASPHKVVSYAAFAARLGLRA